MLCEICGKNQATIHIQELINSKKKVLHICKVCAEGKEAAKEMLSGIDLAQLMLNISSELPGPAIQKDESAKTAESPPMKCPSCGWDIVRFTNAGRLGCSDCFKTFRPILDQAIRNMHKGCMHVGKKPGSAKGASRDRMSQVVALQKKLEDHVRREEYEKAAQTRDKIARLKDSLKNRSRGRKDDKRQSD